MTLIRNLTQHLAVDGSEAVHVDVAGTGSRYVLISQIQNALSGGKVVVSASAPTGADDDTQGFQVGSRWIQTTTQPIYYACTDATTGAAMWVRISSPKFNAAGGGAPTVNDDETLGYEPASIWVDEVGDAVYFCEDAATGAASWIQSGGGSAGGVGSVTASVTLMRQTAAQTTGLTAGSPVIFGAFEGPLTPVGSGITVPANKVAVLEGQVVFGFGADGDNYVVQWYDVTNAQYVGESLWHFNIDRAPTNTDANTGTTIARVETTVDTVYELRIKTVVGTGPTIIEGPDRGTYGKVTVYTEIPGGSNIIGEDSFTNSNSLSVTGINKQEVRGTFSIVNDTGTLGLNHFIINGDDTDANYHGQRIRIHDGTSFINAEYDSAYFVSSDVGSRSYGTFEVKKVDDQVLVIARSQISVGPTRTDLWEHALVYKQNVAEITSIEIRATNSAADAGAPGVNLTSGELKVIDPFSGGSGGAGGGGIAVTVTQLTLSANQTTLTNGANIAFDQETGDSLGLSSGQITIPGGSKATLTADLRPIFGGSSTNLTLGWYDVTNSQEVGRYLISRPLSTTADTTSDGVAQAVVTPSVDTVYELRIIGNNGATSVTENAATAVIVCYSEAAASGGSGATTHSAIAEQLAGFYYEESAGNWRPVYSQRLEDLPVRPNNGTATNPHGIANISRILPMSEFWEYSSTIDAVFPLGYVAIVNSSVDGMWADATNVNWRSGYDRTTWKGNALLYYTKTTDTPVATPPA